MAETGQPTKQAHQKAESGGGIPSHIPKVLKLPGLPVIWVANFLTAEEDRTIGRVSFMSRPPEWHAAGVGYIATVAATVAPALGLDPVAALSAAAGTGVVTGRVWARIGESKHIRTPSRNPRMRRSGRFSGCCRPRGSWPRGGCSG